ncbi:MAG: energy transducer TonB [Paludibacteraceae bacterium]|nr:energy transducer TonB [Paludibacteraceae bacterium]
MKKYFVLALLVFTAVCNAQSVDSAMLVVGDTIYYSAEYEKVQADSAVQFGMVKRINDETNIATIFVYSPEDKHLSAIEKRVASGPNYFDKKGQQIYYYPSGTVECMRFYTMYSDEGDTVPTSKLTEEVFLYPDGVVKEKVTLHYFSAHTVADSYERNCYYPTGEILYHEKLDKGKCTTEYFQPNGKKTKNPKVHYEQYIVMPEFPGGQQELFNFLSSTVRYPIECQEKRIQGRVVVMFTVAKDGVISNIKVQESSGNADLDAEALRVIGAMPKWSPGTLRGKPIRVMYTVPVNFRLQ